MKISYFGHSYFLIEGNDYSICLDPFSNVGLNEVKVKCDYVFTSHNHFDHNNVSLCQGAKKVESAYPFEIVKTYHDEDNGAKRGENSVLIFHLDGYKLAFLGDLGEYGNQNLIEKLKGVDVLLIPVGGKYTIDYNGAYEYALLSQAKCVIPMHYKSGNSIIDVSAVEPFLEKFEHYFNINSPMPYSGETGVFRLIFEENLL